MNSNIFNYLGYNKQKKDHYRIKQENKPVNIEEKSDQEMNSLSKKR